jgi:uncharacterized protein (DUF305 family)
VACASRAVTVASASATAPAHEHALPATGGPGFTAADVRFMQGMIPHHAQAITMAAMAPSHGAGERLLKLAQKIDISQRDEIVFMKRWLAERKQVVPDSMQIHMMVMPGMLTPAQLAQLDAARGAEFDRLFLTFMIQHHEGALTMVDDLLASPGAAQDSDIFRFVSDVDIDQSAEIDVMWSMLDAIPGSDSR